MKRCCQGTSLSFTLPTSLIPGVLYVASLLSWAAQGCFLMKGLSTVLIAHIPQFIFTSSQPVCKETEDPAFICLLPHKQLLTVLSMASFDPSVSSLALHPSKPLGDPFLLWPVEEISHMVMGRLHSRANSLGFLFQFSSAFCAPDSWELPGWRTATLGLQGTLFPPCSPIFPSPPWVCTFIFGL